MRAGTPYGANSTDDRLCSVPRTGRVGREEERPTTRPEPRIHPPALAAWLVTIAALAAAAPAGAAGRPDLTVTRVAAAGVTVAPGSCTASGCGVQLSASARVANRGGRRARRATLGFFLSRDARRDAGDAAAGEQPVRALRAGRRRSAEAALTLTGVAPGAHRLIACADVTRRVRERGERNNCRASPPLTVSSTAAPAPGIPQRPGPCQEPGWRSDLCAELSLAMANRTFFDMADAVTFALLYQHYRTREPIAPSIAAGVIEPLRSAWDPVRGQAGLSTYRVSGFLDFWMFGSYAGVDWPRFPDGLDTPDEFLSWWQTYGIVQFTARQNAINHRVNGIVESEAAWRKAMDEWKAYDLRLVTAQQYSDATVFAHRTLEDAQTAVANAENAVKGP